MCPSLVSAHAPLLHLLTAFADVPAAQELEDLQAFVRAHAKQLQDFDNALEETISDAWDCATDPIALDIEPYEQVYTLHTGTPSLPMSSITCAPPSSLLLCANILFFVLASHVRGLVQPPTPMNGLCP